MDLTTVAAGRNRAHRSRDGGDGARISQRNSAVRLILTGLLLEAVYVVGFVRPYNLVTWLASPAQDLGTLSGATSESAATYLGCVAVLIVGGYVASREACRLPPRLGAMIAFGFAGLFVTTLIWIYPIDALDIFDYTMHGHMVAMLGANPYIALPAWFPDDSFLPFVGWKTYPSVYGPLWTYLEGGIGWLSGDNLLESVLLFKSVAGASTMACIWFVYRITQRWISTPGANAIVLVGWNPLVLLMAGSGHNDLLMMALFLGGVWLLAENRTAAGLWLAGVSILIKAAMAPLLPVLFIGQLFHSRRAGQPVGQNVALPLAALVVTTSAVYAPLWAGLDHVGPLLLANLFSQSPLGLARELWIPSLGEEAATEFAARVGDAALVAIVGVAMWRAHRSHRLAISALQDASFWIVFVALGWWQPWYVVWFVCLAAFDARPGARGLSWVASMTGLVALFDRFYLTQRWLLVDMLNHQWHTFVLVFLLPIAWACVGRRIQTAAPLWLSVVATRASGLSRETAKPLVRAAKSVGLVEAGADPGTS